MTIGIVSEQGNACTYQSVKSIQKNNLDGQPTAPTAGATSPIEQPNLRGADYYANGGDNLLQ
jgi:hypothetical protein